MNLKRAKQEIEAYFVAQLTVELVGTPGVGKSQLIEQLVAEFSARDGFEWGFGVVFLANYTPVDLMGYMIPSRRQFPNHNGEMVEVPVTEFTVPPWMLCRKGRPLNSYKRAILLLDEYGQGEPDVKKASAELLLNKGLGSHRLGPHVFVVACSNHAKDRSGVTKQFDHVINRKATLEIEADFETWEEWATAHGVPPIFILCAKKNQEMVFGNAVPKEQGPWCTPRSYVAGVKLIQARELVRKSKGLTVAGNYGLDDMAEGATIQNMLAGVMGEAGAMTTCNFVRSKIDTPDYEEIVADPKNVKLPPQPDSRFLSIHECAHSLKEADVAKVVEYVQRLPQEFHITFAKAACKRNHRLLNNDDFMKFIKGNVALLNAIG